MKNKKEEEENGKKKTKRKDTTSFERKNGPLVSTSDSLHGCFSNWQDL